MSHYEERLERDLARIRTDVGALGTAVDLALEQAVKALLSRDRVLAYETILGDAPINRASEALDRRCHAFVARHLPSAGHLRFISATIRLNVELERIGDYAATICREAVQLRTAVPELVRRDVELLAGQSRAMLGQAMQAFLSSNADLARGTLSLAREASSTTYKTFADLVEVGEQDTSFTLSDLFAWQTVVYRLKRVRDQAKNVCEQTIFAVTGETKKRGGYRILFVDETNACHSRLAEGIARKAFPGRGHYSSAGWQPAAAVPEQVVDFMASHGISTAAPQPQAFDTRLDALARHDFIVSLGGDFQSHITEAPYATVLLNWSFDATASPPIEAELDALYRDLVGRVGGLMETLFGEEES